MTMPFYATLGDVRAKMFPVELVIMMAKSLALGLKGTCQHEILYH
jgi:hypothetical protein